MVPKFPSKICAKCSLSSKAIRPVPSPPTRAECILIRRIALVEFSSPESARYVRLLHQSSPLFPGKNVLLDFPDEPQVPPPSPYPQAPPLPSAVPPSYTPLKSALPQSYPPAKAVPPAPQPPKPYAPLMAPPGPLFYPPELSMPQMPMNLSQFSELYGLQLGSLTRVPYEK